MEATTIWTIGHSSLTLERFTGMLKTRDIAMVADVRRFPSSRTFPRFNRQTLDIALMATGVEYSWFPELGGRRRPLPDSRNLAWRNEGFRGYADHMETDAFRDGAERLLRIAESKRTAVMCAEAVWWRCHRALIADYLKSRGIAVLHIIDAVKCEPHPYTSAARIADGRLSYEDVFAARGDEDEDETSGPV